MSDKDTPGVVKVIEDLGDRTAQKLARLRTQVETAERERDEARTTINLVRGILAEMHANATRPKGGQSVGERRMPVALSVVLELEKAIGPEQAAYTYGAFLDVLRERDEARAEVERLENELRVPLAVRVKSDSFRANVELAERKLDMQERAEEAEALASSLAGALREIRDTCKAQGNDVHPGYIMELCRRALAEYEAATAKGTDNAP